MRILKKISMFLQGFIILNLLWYLISFSIKSSIVPMPHEVYRYIPELFANNFTTHILSSISRLFVGLSISFFLGGILGVLMGYFKAIDKLLNPLIYFTYPIPKTALLPVLMTIYGLGDGSKIALIVLITIFQIIVSVRDSVKSILKDYYNPLISLGASKAQLIRYVICPAIVPNLLSNLRISLGTSFSILFFAEAYGTSEGIGYFIQDSWSRINYIQMYSGIVVLSFIGLILFLIVDLIEGLLCRWNNSK